MCILARARQQQRAFLDAQYAELRNSIFHIEVILFDMLYADYLKNLSVTV